MADLANERVFRPKDVREAAGLSARQLNDWDARGALPSDRTSDEGWRRFSLREVFAIAVCARLRADFGVPVERLRFVQDFMLRPGADHFGVAVELMASLGVGVWLCTDFQKTFIMDSELEFADLWNHGYFRAEGSRSFVFLNIWPIVDAILRRLDDPIQLEAHGAGYEVIRGARDLLRVRSDDELDVLRKIRSGDYLRVEVTSTDGKVHTIKTTRAFDSDVDLEELLGKEDYQQVTVTKRGGKPRVTQTVTKKPPKSRRG